MKKSLTTIKKFDEAEWGDRGYRVIKGYLFRYPNRYDKRCDSIMLPKWLSNLIERAVSQAYSMGYSKKENEIKVALGLNH